ncbi:MAG: hypothetical protein WB624_01705, partial [Xanthobacteraceae bacterium]
MRELRKATAFARFWHLHVRLFVSAMFGLAVALLLLLLATPWRIPTRILVGWDSGVALYLVLIFWIMERWTADRIR